MSWNFCKTVPHFRDTRPSGLKELYRKAPPIAAWAHISKRSATLADVGANLGPTSSDVIDTVALLKLLESLEGR